LSFARAVSGWAGDEPSATIEGEILEAPLNEDQDAILEFDNVDEVNEEPDQPRGKTGEMQTEDIGDSRGATNDRHVSFVDIVEARGRRFASEPRVYDFGSKAAALNGDLGDAGEGTAILILRDSKISYNKDLRMTGHG
jgi:hypothetical protein